MISMLHVQHLCCDLSLFLFGRPWEIMQCTPLNVRPAVLFYDVNGKGFHAGSYTFHFLASPMTTTEKRGCSKLCLKLRFLNDPCSAPSLHLALIGIRHNVLIVLNPPLSPDFKILTQTTHFNSSSSCYDSEMPMRKQSIV